VRFVVRDDARTTFELTRRNLRNAALVPAGDTSWRLKLPYRVRRSGTHVVTIERNEIFGTGAAGDVVLDGQTAQRALAVILPYLNRGGGGERRVQEAVDLLGESPTIDHLLHAASINTEARKTHVHIKEGESNIGALPARIRLALEMVLRGRRTPRHRRRVP
jgi:hypothetical protein